MSVDLRTCVKGQKLKARYGDILTYMGATDCSRFPHRVLFPDGGIGSRTHEGFVWVKSRGNHDNDIVKIIPLSKEDKRRIVIENIRELANEIIVRMEKDSKQLKKLLKVLAS